MRIRCGGARGGRGEGPGPPPTAGQERQRQRGGAGEELRAGRRRRSGRRRAPQPAGAPCLRPLGVRRPLRARGGAGGGPAGQRLRARAAALVLDLRAHHYARVLRGVQCAAGVPSPRVGPAAAAGAFCRGGQGARGEAAQVAAPYRREGALIRRQGGPGGPREGHQRSRQGQQGVGAQDEAGAVGHAGTAPGPVRSQEDPAGSGRPQAEAERYKEALGVEEAVCGPPLCEAEYPEARGAGSLGRVRQRQQQ
mmetsp:Transcript_40679/g.109178  ORF Transcript_40679/g.109178 Transcript_40679/m.109178 type:complete len:251 (+) Transcript_40679:32-784(+)